MMLTDELRELLVDISKGSGAYNRDPLQHASNCIDEMKATAAKAIEVLDRLTQPAKVDPCYHNWVQCTIEDLGHPKWSGYFCTRCATRKGAAPAPDAASAHPNLQADTAHHFASGSTPDDANGSEGTGMGQRSLPPVGPTPDESEPTAAVDEIAEIVKRHATLLALLHAEQERCDLLAHEIEVLREEADQPRQAATREAVDDPLGLGTPSDAYYNLGGAIIDIEHSPTNDHTSNEPVTAYICDAVSLRTLKRVEAQLAKASAFPERTAKAIGVPSVEEIEQAIAAEVYAAEVYADGTPTDLYKVEGITDAARAIRKMVFDE